MSYVDIVICRGHVVYSGVLIINDCLQTNDAAHSAAAHAHSLITGSVRLSVSLYVCVFMCVSVFVCVLWF